ncbi:uncharacterized protein LOC127868386 [Dreissena polymorpha]|uniref:uncharacterized protein LOC127868386 n=1 Tax=Dreissena polymorpha TaxID=45954 RepID=UPI00226569A1|nr:uncharacterized protein LOC127868386 [Dreissena polymorpha]
MTLENVEIDCRSIFQPGQLGVAISRVRSVEGLRVVNFHPRYLLKPTKEVTDIMNGAGFEPQEDLSCCRKTKTLSMACGEQHTPMDAYHQPPNVPTSTERNTDNEHKKTTITSYTAPDDDEDEDDQLDDDFNEIISALIKSEAQAQTYELNDFNIQDFKENLKFKHPVTNTQVQINGIVDRIDESNLIKFVKKIYLKLNDIEMDFTVSDDKKSIPEKCLVQFYKQLHIFLTGTSYKMDCLMLFNTEKTFANQHMAVCHEIVEKIRILFLEKKVDMLCLSNNRMLKRIVTDTDKARVRYVAGYCVSKLKHKYVKSLKTHQFKTSQSSNSIYHNSKIALQLLDVLKENDLYIKEVTSHPDSLLDIERKQNNAGGLTNVTDEVFTFFFDLTGACISTVTNENLMNYGKNMHEECYNIVRNDNNMFENLLALFPKN